MTRTGKKYPLTKEFREAIINYIASERIANYVFAARVEVSPSYLTGITTGFLNFPLHEARVKRVAETIGYTGPCFVVDEQQTAAAAK
jgi:hypothetical protein